MTGEHEQSSRNAGEDAHEMQGGHARTWTPAQRRRSRRKAAFLRALQEHGGITAACRASGVNDATVWRWRKQYPAFDRAVLDFIEGVREQRVVESLYRLATSDDPKTATAAAKAGEFLLKVWNPHKYQQAQRIEQTVTVNHQVQLIAGFKERQRQALQGIKIIEHEMN